MTKSIRLAPLALVAVAAAAVFTTASPKDASALMAMDTALEGGGGGGTYVAPPPTTYNKIVYLHGRSMGTWPAAAKLVASSSWNHVVLNYNGSARIYDSTVRSTVSNALLSNCSGSNQCVVVCYSAGCARMLQAMDELVGSGTPADKVAWITATASAAGGSEVADAATKWYAKLMAKIFGGSAAIDDDLKVNTMRSTYGYIQNRAPVSMYHMVGRKNMCRKILFVKLCGNKYFPGSLGDGAVPPHSSCGFANSGYFADCAAARGAKYTNRVSQQDALFALDHVGMVGAAVQAASARLGMTATLSTGAMQGETADPDADTTYDDGDTHATNTAQLTDGIGGSIDGNIVASDQCSGGTCTTLSTAATGTYSGGGGGSGSLTLQMY